MHIGRDTVVLAVLLSLALTACKDDEETPTIDQGSAEIGVDVGATLLRPHGSGTQEAPSGLGVVSFTTTADSVAAAMEALSIP